MRTRSLVALGALASVAGGCELQEVVIAESEPFVVVESYLVSPGPRAIVAIHAVAGRAELLLDDATVTLAGPHGAQPFDRIDPRACLAQGVGLDALDFPGGLACYVPSDTMPQSPPPVEAGALYRLDVRLADGRELGGTTRVPERVAFATGIGAVAGCYLEPWTQIELAWAPVDGAAAFLIDLRAFGVREALEREGIEAEVPEPLVLRGLAIGNQDTTIVLPREFGLFDRFVLDAELLIALQQGLPEGIRFEVVLGALDPNYVDWVRGGDFNPSGLIRTPSMYGDAGTGVFGSVTTDTFFGSTHGEDADLLPCGTDQVE